MTWSSAARREDRLAAEDEPLRRSGAAVETPAADLADSRGLGAVVDRAQTGPLNLV